MSKPFDKGTPTYKIPTGPSLNYVIVFWSFLNHLAPTPYVRTISVHKVLKGKSPFPTLTPMSLRNIKMVPNSNALQAYKVIFEKKLHFLNKIYANKAHCGVTLLLKVKGSQRLQRKTK